MKRGLLVIFCITICGLALGQNYDVRIRVLSVNCGCPSTFFGTTTSLGEVTESAGGRTPFVAYDNVISSIDPGFSFRIQAFDDIFPCFCIVDQTSSVRIDLTGSAGCDEQTVSFGSTRVTVETYWEPTGLSITEDSPAGIYCADEQITLSATREYNDYIWEYSFNGTSGWNAVNRPLVQDSRLSGTAQQFFGSNISNVYGRNVYFSARFGDCNRVVSSPYTFYRPIPEVTSSNINAFAPSYSCTNDGGLTLNGLRYSDESNYSGEPILVSIVNFSGTEGFNQSLSGQTNYTITNPAFFSSGTGYRIKIENAVEVGQNTCASPELTFSIPNAPTYVVNSPTVAGTISCSSGVNGPNNDGEVRASVTNGRPPYDYFIKKGSGSYVLDCNNCSGSSHIFTGLDAGTYQVEVRDACGVTLESSGTVTLTEPTSTISLISAGVTSDYNGSDVSCFGESDAVITAAASGGTGSASYSLNSGSYQSSGSFPNLGAGTYTVRARDGNGCFTDATTVTIAPVTAVSISSVNSVDYNGFGVSCLGTANGQITVTGAGGTGAKSFSIDAGASYQSLNTFTGLAPGTYTIKVRDANNCESSTQSIILTAPPALTVSANITSDYDGRALSCNGASDGQITVSGSGGVGTRQYSIDNGITFLSATVFNNLSAGTYLVKVRDENGCISDASGPIVLADPPGIEAIETVSDYNGRSISCQGASDGSITLNVSGGSGMYSYSWSTGETSKDLSNLTAGTYTVTITDSNGCDEQETYLLTEPFVLLESVLTSDYNGVGISCAGASDGSIDLEVTGGTGPYSYLWSTGSTSEDLNSLAAGAYSVTITDVNGCDLSLTNINITAPSALTHSLSTQTNVDCNGNASGSVDLQASGGVMGKTYTLDGTITQPTGQFDDLPAGFYTVEVEDANGCADQVSFTITEPSPLTSQVTSTSDATCSDPNGSATVAVNGGTSSYSYRWENSLNQPVGTSAILTGAPGGIYTAIITDANGCITTSTATISSEDGAEATTSSLAGTSCFNSADGSATVSIVGVGPFDVLWSSGETTLTAANLLPGSNTVTITDANGCTVVETITIPSPAAITSSIVTEQTPTCWDSSDGALEIQASGGTGSYTYTWSTGTSGALLTNVTQGAYTVTITDSNGCELEEELTLIGVEEITLTTEAIRPSCEGQSDGSLSVTTTGGNGNYNYDWSTGSTSNSIINIPSGTYSVTVTDERGCTITEDLVLGEADPFEIAIEDVVVCTGSVAQVTAPVSGTSYSWTSSTGFASTAASVMLTDPGEYTLTVINEDDCEATDSFVLTTSDDILNADFLMVTEAYVGDTVVIIDISWPIPETLTWDFGTDLTVLIENQDYAEVVFNAPGTYEVNIETALADCRDMYGQSITILDRSEKPDDGGRQASGAEPLVKTFKVSPNPNNGEFVVLVELNESAPIRLTLIGIRGNRIQRANAYETNNKFDIPMNILSSKKGIYFLLLETNNQKSIKRIMVN